MAEPVQQYGSISLSSRGGASQGLLRVNAGGFTWRRSTGGKHVDIKTEASEGYLHPKGYCTESRDVHNTLGESCTGWDGDCVVWSPDVERLVWMRVSRGYMLGVRQRKGITMNFIGFRDRDLDPLREISKAAFNKDIEETSLSLTGKNWGDIAIHGSSMVFDVGSKPAFELPLPDVAQVDQQKDEVAMEFHLDDTVISDKEDALVGIAFHVPPGNQTFPPDEDSGLNPAKVFADNILGLTDAQATSAEDSVATLMNVSIQNPRGRFQVELHLGFMHLVGQNNDYKIRYTSIARLFILPKPNPPLTVVVVSLDPPIRKGQTYYQHILCQFDNKEELTLQLDLTSEQLAEKNERHGSQLKQTMSGTSWEVFAKVVKGLSGTKITKPNTFRAADGRSYAVKCSYKADDGFLFFLEKAFFYIHKPPLLIVHDEIASIEFQRQDRDMLAATVKTFDLAINTKQNTVHLFRGIQRQEYQEIFNFLEAKKLRIENFEEAARGPAVRQGLDLGDMMDPGMRAMAMGADSDEDDEDFEMGAEARSGSDGGGSDSEGSEVEMVAEDGIQAADIEEKPRHPKPSASPGASPSGSPRPTEKPRAPSGKKRAKAAAAAEAAGGGEADAAPTGKKKRKKKDPNAPKRAQSAYLCFANRNREAVKQDNPDLKQTELMKAIADRWKELSAEDRKPYEELAAADKERYAREMAEYQAKNGAAAGGSGDADAVEANAGDA